MGTYWPATASSLSPLTQFDINAAQADASLIEFAKQANLTIIFPFDKVQGNRANPLKGQFTVEEAIEHLLKDTGLIAQFNEKGALIIKLQADVEAEREKGLLEKLKDLFTARGDNLVTYPEEESAYELILVKGIRASMQRSMDIKQSSNGLVDVITAEDIGKFPDLNLAESLQRITGVSIDRAEGEGQFVTVRGLGPQFNTVLINGRRLATDNRGREFSFDTLASELVSGVSIHKTFDATQTSGGIGSTINIQTARPLTARGFRVAGSVKAMYDSNRQKTSPQASILVSHSNQKIGWLVALSQQKRLAQINEAQIDGWLLNTDIPATELSSDAKNVFVPRNYDQRVRFDDRERVGGTLVLQYRPRADLDISFDYLTSRFEVETNSTSMGHWFTSSNLENVFTDDNGTAVQFEQNVGHATDFHARTFDRPSSVRTLGLNVEWQSSHFLSLNFDASFSDATIDDTQGAANALSLIGYLNRSRFDHTRGDILPTISGFEAPDPDVLDAFGEPSGVEHYLDPANGRAHVMLRRGWDIRDDFDQLRLDGDLDLELDNLSALQVGLMWTRQVKQNDRWDNEQGAVHCTFCGYFPSPDIPDEFQSIFHAGDGFLSSVSGHERLPKSWLRHDGETLFQFLEQASGLSFAAVKRNNSFAIKEQVSAAYLSSLWQHELGEAELITQAGLRFENTDISVSGVEADLIALRILDQTELGQQTSTPRPIEQSANYHNWLPSVSFKLNFNENMTARLAWSKSLTRPTMTQMSPSLVLDTTRQGGDLRASSGNPALRPFESDNLDIAWEWYYQQDSYFSVSYFRKVVDNFIVSRVTPLTINDVTDPSTGDNPDAPDDNDAVARFDLTQPVNGETATVDGWELAIQHSFDNGLGILANMTRVDSNAKLDTQDVAQKFALTGLSDSQNVILFYEHERWQARLAWNYRDGFLQSLVQNQGGEPTFVDDYQQWDFSASYAITPNVSVFFEGINLTEEVLFKHGRFSNQLLLAQDPGKRMAFGIRGNFSI